uniref:Restricted tev movement 1 n=1 Tax=Solanum tuberosum TaxID=4113 RepID=M1DP85_SOLTU
MSVKMNLMKVGPAGGKEKKGGVWDEKGKGEIAKIFVSDDKHAIQSLQFLFVKNGNFVLSKRHGDTAHDANFATVVLDYQSEFLTWISGFHDLEPNNKWMYLRSITFGTNKGTYGPHGMKTAVNLKLKEFYFQIGDDRSFGGFHGTKHGTYYSNGLRSITFVTNKGTHGPYGGVKPMTVDREIDFQIGNDRSFGGFHCLCQKTYIESIGLYLEPITPSMIKPRKKTN